jgi:hypothetical protein
MPGIFHFCVPQRQILAVRDKTCSIAIAISKANKQAINQKISKK